MTRFTLIGRGESGNTYKIALMLNLCALEWKPQFVDFFNPETKSAFAASVNEMAEIPVLEFDGKRLSQSGAILTCLSDITGKFAGRDADERLDVLRWLLFDNHRFSNFFATLRMRIGLRREAESPITEFLRIQTMSAFSVVENHLIGRSFIVNDRPTIADISMAGYIYFDEETGIDRTAYPNIERWAKRVSELPGWAPPYALMPRAMRA